MAAVLVELVPLILGAMLAPVWVIIVLLLLASPPGLPKAGAFVLGITLTRLAQGLIFSILFSAASDADDGKSPIVSILLLLVGILLLVTAVRKWRKEEDPDDPPPQWMSSIEQTSPLKALGLGALLIAIGPKMWVFTLSALGIISASELGLAGGLAVYLAYVVLAQSLLLIAILIVALAPKASTAILQRALNWLKAYNRPISITVALIFGVYFTWDGAMGLLS
jgi:hypothetical protein